MMSEAFDSTNQFSDSLSNFDPKSHPGLISTQAGLTRIQSSDGMSGAENGIGQGNRRNSQASNNSPRDFALNMCNNASLLLAQSKLDSLKSWSISTYKCTRQALQEKLGKTNRTVDVELEQNIDALKDMQNRYNCILVLARSLAAHFSNMLNSQRQLGENLNEMASKEIDLQEEFQRNAECQILIAKNGERLLSAMNFFISSLQTLCDKTIEDTILTIKIFENSRLEFDAHKNDLEQLQQAQNRSADFQQNLHDLEITCQQHKIKYEQLRDDVQVKMNFVHENKVKVMQKQLILLHNATASFFSGNHSRLEAVIKQFGVNSKNFSSKSSWLEG